MYGQFRVENPGDSEISSNHTSRLNVIHNARTPFNTLLMVIGTNYLERLWLSLTEYFQTEGRDRFVGMAFDRIKRN